MIRKLLQPFKHMGEIDKKLTRILRTDVSYISKNLPLVMTKDVLSTLSVLTISVAAANFLTPETYGTYKYLIALGLLATSFHLIGANSALIKSTARGYTGTVYALLRKLLTWGSIGFTICLIIAIYYLIQDEYVFAVSIMTIGVMQPLIQSGGLYVGYLTGLQDFKSVALYGGLTSAIVALTMSFAMYITDQAMILILINFLGLGIITWLIFTIVISIHKPDTNKVDTESLEYSVNLSLMSFIGNISSRIDQVIVFQLLGPVKLAIYSFTYTPVSQLIGLNNTVGTIAIPKMSKRDFASLKLSLHRKVLIALVISFIAYIVYFVSAPLIFKILFSQYQTYVPYTQALGILILFMPTILYQQAFIAHAKTREMYIIKTIVPIFKICILFLLTLLFGLSGVIASLIGAAALKLGLYVYFINRTTPIE